MTAAFKVVDQLPAGRGTTAMKAAELVAAAAKARGKWVQGHTYEKAKTANVRASRLRVKYPDFEFASRQGVVYCRKLAATK